MADRWAVASGNWSDTSTWNGGTLPTSADDVWPNGFTVTIDQNITVLSLRTTTRSGLTSGGTFIMSGGFNITATGLGLSGMMQTVLTYSGNSNITISANINGAGIGNQPGVVISGSTPVVNIVGNCFGGSSTSCHGVLVSGESATVNITGNCRAGFGLSAGAAVTGTNGVLNVTGNAFGADNTGGSPSSGIIASGSNATINLTGNATAGLFAGSYGVDTTGSFTIVNITGNATASSTASTHGVRSTGAFSMVNIIGSATANSNLSHGIVCSATARGVVFQGSMADSPSGAVAVYSRIFRMSATNSGVTQYANTVGFPNGTLVSRVSPNNTTGTPNPIDVRRGVSYGYNNEVTGTLAVPPAQAVKYGTPVGATVGSGEFDLARTASVLAEAIASGMTAGSRQ